MDFFNEELMRFLSFNNAILSSIKDVIIVSDPAGRVVYQNPAAARLDGYSEEPPFAPDYFASLLDGRTFSAEFASVIATGEPTTLEFVPGRLPANPIFAGNQGSLFLAASLLLERNSLTFALNSSYP